MDQNTNGIVGPVSLTQAHPALTEKLRVERGKSLGAGNKVGFAQLPKGCPNEGAPCTSADISIDSFYSSDFVVPKEKLTRIGSNAVGPDPQEQGQELSFPLTIQLDDQQLRLKGGSSLPLQVGMSPTANIKLRKVSYLQLLLGEFPDNAELLQRL